ncbi:putative polysaccharide biosynthesis protein [Limtongia smithiae]|uniref:putative polysaccharide biosynthesis protein n=1 Tax=Limtongia smithiae TaxID=1125753 RepID=UPI0034CE28D4
MSASNFDAENAENLEDIEKQFAVKAVMQAQTYWNLLEKVRGSTLSLTRLDEEIYTHFLNDFPEYSTTESVAQIKEEDLKSVSGKDRWRKFMAKYEKTVHDYNFGTLLRTGATCEYENETTIFVVRMQFLAFEIARNKQGMNDWIFEKAQSEAQKK